jgi:hypothetical protein
MKLKQGMIEPDGAVVLYCLLKILEDDLFQNDLELSVDR